MPRREEARQLPVGALGGVGVEPAPPRACFRTSPPSYCSPYHSPYCTPPLLLFELAPPRAGGASTHGASVWGGPAGRAWGRTSPLRARGRGPCRARTRPTASRRRAPSSPRGHRGGTRTSARASIRPRTRSGGAPRPTDQAPCAPWTQGQGPAWGARGARGALGGPSAQPAWARRSGFVGPPQSQGTRTITSRDAHASGLCARASAARAAWNSSASHSPTPMDKNWSTPSAPGQRGPEPATPRPAPASASAPGGGKWRWSRRRCVSQATPTRSGRHAHAPRTGSAAGQAPPRQNRAQFHSTRACAATCPRKAHFTRQRGVARRGASAECAHCGGQGVVGRGTSRTARARGAPGRSCTRTNLKRL
jgi:hypothetical protein